MTSTDRQRKRKKSSSNMEAELALFEQEIASASAAATAEEETVNDIGASSNARLEIGAAEKPKQDTSSKKKKRKKMSEQEMMNALLQFDQEVASAAAAAVEAEPPTAATATTVSTPVVASTTATVSAAPTLFYPVSDMRSMVQQKQPQQQQQQQRGTSYYYENESYRPYYGQYEDVSGVDYNALLARSSDHTSTNGQSQSQQQQQQQQQGKTIKRSADGKTWEDPILAQFPENDFRIFVGNIGNDVTDDVLARAFQHFPSFAVARVVRDKKTRKSRGYGFVSLMDPNDFLKALDTMNGKYIGNRPCQLRRGKWQERNFDSAKSKKMRQMYS